MVKITLKMNSAFFRNSAFGVPRSGSRGLREAMDMQFRMITSKTKESNALCVTKRSKNRRQGETGFCTRLPDELEALPARRESCGPSPRASALSSAHIGDFGLVWNFFTCPNVFSYV